MRKYPEPVSVEDLRLRAVVSLGLVAQAQGQPSLAHTRLLEAIKGMAAQYRSTNSSTDSPADSPVFAPVWAALARSASAAGQTREADTFAAKARRAAARARS